MDLKTFYIGDIPELGIQEGIYGIFFREYGYSGLKCFNIILARVKSISNQDGRFVRAYELPIDICHSITAQEIANIDSRPDERLPSRFMDDFLRRKRPFFAIPARGNPILYNLVRELGVLPITLADPIFLFNDDSGIDAMLFPADIVEKWYTE